LTSDSDCEDNISWVTAGQKLIPIRKFVCKIFNETFLFKYTDSTIVETEVVKTQNIDGEKIKIFP